MEKYVSFDKLSKKKQRQINALRRGSWGALKPVTRRSADPKAYNRQKARKRSDDPDSASFLLPANREPEPVATRQI